MPIKFYSDALGKVIEPNYDAIPNISDMTDEEFEKLLLTEAYIIYTPEGEEILFTGEDKENESNI